MLTGHGNWKCQKKKNQQGLSAKKKKYARAAYFSCTFVCRCFARLERS